MSGYQGRGRYPNNRGGRGGVLNQIRRYIAYLTRQFKKSAMAIDSGSIDWLLAASSWSVRQPAPNIVRWLPIFAQHHSY